MTWGGIGGADHFTDVKIRPRKVPFACHPDLLICPASCLPATHRALLNTHRVHQFCLPRVSWVRTDQVGEEAEKSL